MIDVIVDGNVIVRATTEGEGKIYELNFKGLRNEDIADILHIPLRAVTRLTEGGATR